MAFPLAPPCGNTTFKKCLTSYWAFEFYFFVFTEQFVPSIVIARFLFFRQKNDTMSCIFTEGNLSLFNFTKEKGMP